MSKFYYGVVRANTVFIVLAVMMAIFSESSVASDELQSGSQYKIIRPIYLKAVYDSLNNRTLSKDSARAYLRPNKSYKKAEVAFQDEVPVGTVITITGPAPKKWYLLWGANKYLVRLDPDLSRGLDVVLKLNREIEGDLDGLNPELFARILGDAEL